MVDPKCSLFRYISAVKVPRVMILGAKYMVLVATHIFVKRTFYLHGGLIEFQDGCSILLNMVYVSISNGIKYAPIDQHM